MGFFVSDGSYVNDFTAFGEVFSEFVFGDFVGEVSDEDGFGVVEVFFGGGVYSKDVSFEFYSVFFEGLFGGFFGLV